MQYAVFRVFALGFTFITSNAALGATFRYLGNFSDVHTSDDACTDVFMDETYQTRLFVFSGLRFVLAWDRDDHSGFLRGRSVLGHIGAGNEFLGERTVQTPRGKLRLKAGGIVEEHAIYYRLLVQKLGSDGRPVCEAHADYLGSAQ